MLPFKIADVCFSVVNNNFGEGHKWQNMLLALLLPAEVKQPALTGGSGPNGEYSLCLHIVAEFHHAHTALEHVMQSVVFRDKFRSYRQARSITGRKFPLSRIFLYFREKQLGFSSLSAPQMGALSTSWLTLQSPFSHEAVFISADLDYFVFWDSVG